MDMTPEELARVVGRNIRHHRTRLGLSQTALADLIDMDQSYISDVEAGKRMPRLATIAVLAAALEVPPSQLMDGQELTPAL